MKILLLVVVVALGLVVGSATLSPLSAQETPTPEATPATDSTPTPTPTPTPSDSPESNEADASGTPSAQETPTPEVTPTTDSTPTPTPTPTPSDSSESNGSAEGSSATDPFQARFDTLDAQYYPQPDASGAGAIAVPDFTAPEGITRACVPDQQQFNAYGFYTLSTQDQQVNFSVYSRVQYYALEPSWDGNLVTPVDWTGPEVTRAAHRHGSRVDLVIANRLWWYEDGTPSDPLYDEERGLWLTKSFVLLTLINEIADAVRLHDFDGATIDFRLPTNVDTIESYSFLVNSLKKRLAEDGDVSTDRDLLRPDPKKLNIVVDRALVDSLAASYVARNETLTGRSDAEVRELNSADTVPALAEFFDGVADSVNLVFYREDIRTDAEEALRELDFDSSNLVLVPFISNTSDNNQFNASRIRSNSVVIWDIAGDGAGWLTSEDNPDGLDSKVFGTGPNAKYLVSNLVCTSRAIIVDVLTGTTPVLALLVLLSWVLYDFPRWPSRIIRKLILWGLIFLAFVAFVLLLFGLPSLNLKNIQFYVIIAAFLVPLLYLLWGLASLLSEHDYP